MKKTIVIVLLGALFLTGCGTTIADEIAKQGKENGTEKAQEEVTEEVTEEVEETEADTKDDAAAKEKELLEAKRKSRYADALVQFIYAGTWPDGSMVDEFDTEFGSIEENQFSICDVDGDGEEELIISYSTASMAGMQENVYGYDSETDTVYQELAEFPSITYYENGWLEAGASHNHSMGMDFWPYSLYHYDSTTKEYELIGTVDAWDKSYFPESYSGEVFPEELDKDGDGILYFFHEGEDTSYENGMDEADYETWYASMLKDAKSLDVSWKTLTYDNFSDYAKKYVELLCEKEMEKGLVYGKDLGLQMMQGGMGISDLETILSERCGVEITDVDEYGDQRIGTYEGQEVFTFDYLNAGFIGYENEQVQDFTILGIYPGMEATKAQELLEEFGMIPMEIEDGENVFYFTGKGFGNFGIWLAVTNGKVTCIQLGEYCAYAG
ncbi:MAG: hypothetical protein ACI4ES_03945 [Roseburia sp.]